MPRYRELTDEETAYWAEWPKGRPQIVQDLAARFDPWTLYRLKTTGHLVEMLAIAENGTLRVFIAACVNPGLDFEREVFGINPDDLEECGVPEITDNEPLMSPAEVDANIDIIRVTRRPDLFVTGDDGKAARKN